MTGLRGWTPWIVATALLVVLPHVPGLDSNFARSLISQMGISVIFALSYNMLLGQTGLLSFGHAVYFGLGAYATVHAMRLGAGAWPVPFMPLIGAATGLAFGLLFGAIINRRAGTVFAMITLGLGELVAALSLMLTGLFGGEEGVSADRLRLPPFLGYKFGPQLQVYYVIAFWVLLSAALMYAFTRTPLGRMCNAVRDNSERAEFVGYNPQRVRFLACAAAGLFAGVAGALNAINYEIVTAESLSAFRSGAVLLMAYIGGVGHFIGPVVGAVVITWLQASLSDYTNAWLLYVGIFFILVVLFAPGGLAGLITAHGPLARTGQLPRLLPAYGTIALPLALMLLGGTALIEISYRLSTKPELGTKMAVFWIKFDAATPWPWLVAGAMLALGTLAFVKLAPGVGRAWDEATTEARRRLAS